MSRLKLKYQTEGDNNFVYTEEIKSMLDKRYDDYINNKVKMVNAEDSQQRIKALFANQSK